MCGLLYRLVGFVGFSLLYQQIKMDGSLRSTLQSLSAVMHEEFTVDEPLLTLLFSNKLVDRRTNEIIQSKAAEWDKAGILFDFMYHNYINETLAKFCKVVEKYAEHNCRFKLTEFCDKVRKTFKDKSGSNLSAFGSSNEEIIGFTEPEGEGQSSKGRANPKMIHLQDYIPRLQDKWEEIGNALGLEYDVTAMDKRMPKENLRELFKSWIQGGTKTVDGVEIEVTWKFLTDVLRSDAIDKGAVAEKIEQKFM